MYGKGLVFFEGFFELIFFFDIFIDENLCEVLNEFV